MQTRLVYQRDGRVEVSGETGLRVVHYRAGSLLVLRRPGRTGSDLLHSIYYPAVFEVWELETHDDKDRNPVGRRVATFPVQGVRRR